MPVTTADSSFSLQPTLLRKCDIGGGPSPGTGAAPLCGRVVCNKAGATLGLPAHPLSSLPHRLAKCIVGLNTPPGRAPWCS